MSLFINQVLDRLYGSVALIVIRIIDTPWGIELNARHNIILITVMVSDCLEICLSRIENCNILLSNFQI